MTSIVKRFRNGGKGKKKKSRSDSASTSDASSVSSKKQHQQQHFCGDQLEKLPQHLTVSSTASSSRPASPVVGIKQVHSHDGSDDDDDNAVYEGDDYYSENREQGATLSVKTKPLHLQPVQQSPDASVATAATAASVTPCSSTGDAASDGQHSHDGGGSVNWNSIRPTRLSYLRKGGSSSRTLNKDQGNETSAPSSSRTLGSTSKRSQQNGAKKSAVLSSSSAATTKANGGSSEAHQGQSNRSISSKKKGMKGLKFFRSSSSQASSETSSQQQTSTQVKVPAYIDTTRFLHKSSFRKTTPRARSKVIAASLSAAKNRPMGASPPPPPISTRKRSTAAPRPESAPSRRSKPAIHCRPLEDLPEVPLPDENDDAKTALAKAHAASALNALKKKEADRIARAAAALDNQGNELFEKGYFDKAMAAYTKALKLKRRTFHSLLEDADEVIPELDNENDDKSVLTASKSDPKLLVSMATSINNIGYLRQRSGDATPDETMAAYRKSLRIKRGILGHDNLSVGKTLNNIGSVHYLKRDYPGALLAYSEALQIMESNLGTEHPDVATVWSNIGDVHLGMRQMKPDEKKQHNEQALSHYKRALSIRWAVFGDHDPRVMRLLEKIAAIEMSETTMMMCTNSDDDDTDAFNDSSLIWGPDDLPVSRQLHLLYDECIADVQYIDLLQKKMALDMVKDKVHILRGMRELSYEEERYEEEVVLSKSSTDLNDNDDDDNRSVATHESTSSSRVPFVDRSQALQSVKDRLAKIRADRTNSISEQSTSSIQRCSASLGRTRSAFVLKQGIQSLRSHKEEDDDEEE